jgi:hypothetical protein
MKWVLQTRNVPLSKQIGRGSGEEEKKATFHIKKTAIPAARRGNRR